MSQLPGLGTLLNVVAIVSGAAIGLLIGHRLPQRVRDLVTDVLGLATLLIGALSALDVTSDSLRSAVGSGFPVLIVLGSLLIGGFIGSFLKIEQRLETFGLWLRRTFVRRATASSDVAGQTDRQNRDSVRFVEGFVSASLLFCVGPLAILGAVNDGLGRGIEQLALKSVLDGFASMAFAASLGVGVMLSAIPVLIYQGLVTFLGYELGGVLTGAQIAALTATGGLMLIGIGIRLLGLKNIAVADMLPALVIAPLAVALVAR